MYFGFVFFHTILTVAEYSDTHFCNDYSVLVGFFIGNNKNGHPGVCFVHPRTSCSKYGIQFL